MSLTCCTGQQDFKSTSSTDRVQYGKTKPLRTSTVVGLGDKVETSLFLDLDKICNNADSKVETKNVNMFLRAQNREFFGMTESNDSIWTGNYEFICMGDPQFGMGDQERVEEFSRLAVEFINQRKNRIKFVIVCGDHTHNLEDFWSKGDIEGGRMKRLQELAAYKKIYSRLDKDIPLVCVCGNHDVGNKPTAKTIQLYKEEFGDDYFSFWCGGVKFCVINSQIIQGLEPSNELSIAHEKWVDEEFEKKHENEPVHSVVMCHIPPFCWDVEEQNTNFNWPKSKREMWLDKMLKADVKKVYCSHYHRRAGGIYKGLEVVVSGALGTHILTKDTPKELRKSKLDEINFKLSYQGFGGTEVNEKTSGLQIVSVSREGLNEKWLNIAQMKKELKF